MIFYSYGFDKMYKDLEKKLLVVGYKERHRGVRGEVSKLSTSEV